MTFKLTKSKSLRAAFLIFALALVITPGVAIVKNVSFHAGDKAGSSAIDAPIAAVIPKPLLATDIDVTQVLSGINSQRTAAVLPPLASNPNLQQAANARADDMLAKKYFNNTENSPASFIVQNGYAASIWSLSMNTALIDTSGTIAWLRTEVEAKFVNNKAMSDIGIGVRKGSVQGTDRLVVVIYLSHRQIATNTNPGGVTSSYQNYTVPAYTPIAVPTYTPAAVCDASSKTASLTATYNHAVYVENSRYNTLSGQINAAIAQVINAGAGSSSAMTQLQMAKAQNNSQHSSTLSSLSVQYQSDLAAISCS